jgi:hypothetical protein
MLMSNRHNGARTSLPYELSPEAAYLLACLVAIFLGGDQ